MKLGQNPNLPSLVEDALDNHIVNETLTSDEAERIARLIIFCYEEWKKP